MEGSFDVASGAAPRLRCNNHRHAVSADEQFHPETEKFVLELTHDRSLPARTSCRSFERANDFGGNPAPIEASFLGNDGFAVDKTLDRVWVKRHIPGPGCELGIGRWVSPSNRWADRRAGDRRQRKVFGLTFPFAM